jgi:signal transduction histidine kinase
MATPSKPVSRTGKPDEVERARCLEVFAASLIHEINQPLSVLVGNAEACLRKLSPTALDLEGARDAALRTVQEAQRAAALIQRMWSLFAKTEANNESVDLNEAAMAALRLSSQKLELRQVIARSELEADLPRIAGDSLQLQQVILNLVTNAAEAMDEVHDRPRELVVRTQSLDAHVRLSVRDAGEGFSPGDAERLFDAFYTTKRDGSGIGLFISRWIIENHGGAIHAALNDDPGATFSFLIPCRRSSRLVAERPGTQ